MRLARVAPVVVASASVALSIWIAIADARLDDDLRLGWREMGFSLIAASVIAGIGCLIATRSHASRIGWLLIGLSVALPTYDTLVANTVEADGDAPWIARLVIGLTSASWLFVFALIATIAIVFPDGRPATPRWRNVLFVSAAGWAAVIFGIVTSEHPATGGRYADVLGPLPVLETVGLVAFVPGYAVTIASLPLACAALVTRLRRSQGIERLQLKWLAYAVTLLPLTFFVCIGLWLAGGLDPDDSGAGEIVGVLYVSLVLGVSGAVAIAITRYGLYRIDWISNRTLVYATLTGLLAGAWLGISLGLGATLGGRSAWTAALATAVVALAFLPLCRRLQDIVDRRLSRSRYEAVAVIRALEDAVRDGRAEPEQIGDAQREALRDPTAELLLRLPDEETLVRCGVAGPAVLDDRAASSIVREGQEIGVLHHDPCLADRPEVLHAVLAAAGLPIELARLRVELRRRLSEVEELRRRIVRAGY